MGRIWENSPTPGAARRWVGQGPAPPPGVRPQVQVSPCVLPHPSQHPETTPHPPETSCFQLMLIQNPCPLSSVHPA